MRFFFFEEEVGVEAAGEEGPRGEHGGVLGGVVNWPGDRPFEDTEVCLAGFCRKKLIMRPRLDIRENFLALPLSSPLARHMNSWNSIVPLAETSRRALLMAKSSEASTPLPVDILGLLLPFDPFPRGRETKSSSAIPDTNPVPWLRTSKARQQASSRIGTLLPALAFEAGTDMKTAMNSVQFRMPPESTSESKVRKSADATSPTLLSSEAAFSKEARTNLPSQTNSSA